MSTATAVDQIKILQSVIAKIGQAEIPEVKQPDSGVIPTSSRRAMNSRILSFMQFERSWPL